VASTPVREHQSIRLGDGYELDLRLRRLRRGSHVLKLERIPLEILVLLVEHKDEIVTRDEIVSRVWGKGVFLDTDNSIRGAIRKLRQALKDDADSPRFIQTVTGQGYRFIAPVTTPEEGNLAGASTSEASAISTSGPNRMSAFDGSSQDRRVRLLEAQQDQTAGRVARGEIDRAQRTRHALGWIVLGALALLALVVTTAYIITRERAAEATRGKMPPEKIVLAVLPFDNLSRDPDQDFFSDGLTEDMITLLGKLNRARLTVIARGYVAKYKGSKLPADQIARELHADYLVQGSVRRSSDRVRVAVELIQARGQTNVWAESYDRELKDMFAVQDSVVRTVANQIHIALNSEQQRRLASPRRVDPEAYEAYIKGRYYWSKRTIDGMEKGERYFQGAIDKDPSYSAAYSGLADCNSGLAWHGFVSPDEALPRAHAAALKAIELDPQSAEAHASLALLLDHRWDWPGAEAEFKRALQLDPQNANAHHWYGDYLSIKGRHDEALLQARQALELDPLNLMIGTWAGLRYYLARKYDPAIEQGRNTVELDPTFAAAHLLLGEIYVQKGLHEKGLAELQRAAGLSGNSPLYLAQVAVAQASAGRKTEALRIVAQLQALSSNRYVSPYGIAQIYAALNDKEQTFKWLQIAYEDRAVWMSYLAVDPVFDGFRSDQRFQDLLRGVRLLP
jgi:TolB-like protein/DNA-binding winged helix-turn-helix (wHTH) protein/Flp pilus assembly protein TadD